MSADMMARPTFGPATFEKERGAEWPPSCVTLARSTPYLLRNLRTSGLRSCEFEIWRSGGRREWGVRLHARG
eukprot:364794-Chlamydomonas_euryale.AAC.12